MKTKKKITLLTLTSAMIVGVGVGITIYSPQCASKIKESTSRTATTDDIEPITVEIPKIKKYTVEIENVELVKIKTYKFVSQIELKQINLPEVKKNDDRIPEMIKLQKIQMKLFKDQRNLMYDKTIGLDSKIWKECG